MTVSAGDLVDGALVAPGLGGDGVSSEGDPGGDGVGSDGVSDGVGSGSSVADGAEEGTSRNDGVRVSTPFDGSRAALRLASSVGRSLVEGSPSGSAVPAGVSAGSTELSTEVSTDVGPGSSPCGTNSIQAPTTASSVMLPPITDAYNAPRDAQTEGAARFPDIGSDSMCYW